jgi:outer membrane protein
MLIFRQGMRSGLSPKKLTWGTEEGNAFPLRQSTMKKLLHFLALGAALAATVPAFAAESPWSLRVGATYLDTANHSSAFTALSTFFPANSITVESKWMPEFDVGYAFSDTWRAELVLTIPQTHEVKLKGFGKLGSFKELPPTLLVQYWPKLSESFHPYVGAGVNFTLIWDDKLAAGPAVLNLDTYSVGVAAQGGFDWKLNDRWSFNANVKWMVLQSDVSTGGAKLTSVQVDPWLFSFGARYRF